VTTPFQKTTQHIWVFNDISFSYLLLTLDYWSWVDRMWSIVPAVYVIIFACYSPNCHRLVLMSVLTSMWGIRLTFNFWRKGGFNEEEDYRWPVLRKWCKENDPFHPLGRELFQFSFVACYQHLLLWLIAAPSASRVYYYFNNNTRQNNVSTGLFQLLPEDYFLGGLFVFLLLLETIADETQWRFQSRKHKLSEKERQKEGGDYARGFCTSGVFKYSRHLNFFCEQCLWWTIYGFSIIPSLYDEQGNRVVGAGVEQILNFTILGPFLLSLLFMGSTTMTEHLSVAKYPAYKDYQRTTSRLMPWFPGTNLDSLAGQELVKMAVLSDDKQDTKGKKKST
jgi:steroid 5-alpha reductase family enzyme